MAYPDSLQLPAIYLEPVAAYKDASYLLQIFLVLAGILLKMAADKIFQKFSEKRQINIDNEEANKATTMKDAQIPFYWEWHIDELKVAAKEKGIYNKQLKIALIRDLVADAIRLL